MKLNWKMGQQMLVANENGYEFRVSWSPEREWQGQRFDPDYFRGNHQACSGLYGASSIESAIAWCEKNAETSGAASKFPSTMDAEKWAEAYADAEPIMRGGDAPLVLPWFQAALSHGFREGQASVYELVDRAQRQRDCFGLKTSSPIDSFDARVWAEELRKAVGATDGCKIFAVSLELMETWFANALMRGYDERRSKETGWQKFSRDMYAKFLEKNPLPGFGYEEAPAVKSDLGAAVAFLTKRVGDLEAAVVNEQGRTMELSVDLKGALDRLAKLEART